MWYFYVIDGEEGEAAGAASLPTQPPQPSTSSAFDPGSVPAGSYSGIQIPPGAHAPANTPAEVPHSTGATDSLTTSRFPYSCKPHDLLYVCLINNVHAAKDLKSFDPTENIEFFSSKF